MANRTSMLNSKAVQSIMNKRVLVPKSKDGIKIRFTVQGDGTWMDVRDSKGDFVMSATDEGVVLRKKIFNLQATSEVAMANPLFKKVLIDALKAERAGDAEKADELFNTYLNKTQVSFSVLDNQRVLDKIQNGVDIAAKVQLIATENGEIITIDPSTISVIEPEVLKTVRFDLASLTGLSDEELAEEEEETEEEKLAKMTPAERKAYLKANPKPRATV